MTSKAEKAEKSEKGKLESTCLFACLPDTNKETFRVSLLESSLLFLINQDIRSCGIVCSSFSWNLLLLFLLKHGFKILVKSRKEGTFSCLASIAC